jgi:peptidoglycan/LPS O-acetylase OafA/YrhL
MAEVRTLYIDGWRAFAVLLVIYTHTLVNLPYLKIENGPDFGKLERFPRNVNLRDSQIRRDVIHH